MAKQLPFRLILASGSPARRDLLTRAGYAFEVLPADVAEPTGPNFPDARALVQYTAWLKAAAVASRVADGVVLAADTVGWIDGQVIGKPADEADARRILHLLGGKEHELWTGVCLWCRPGDRQLAWQEMSRVSFQALTDAELATYLATRQWQGCSGAYAILEHDDPFVRVVHGSISNVIGLPMETSEMVLQRLADGWVPMQTGQA
jgi:septum formation protein